MPLKMEDLAKDLRRNFSHLAESESLALGTEFLCAIVSVCLIAVVAQFAYNVEGGMPLKYAALLLPLVVSRAVTLVGCPVPLQLKCRRTGCQVCAQCHPSCSRTMLPGALGPHGMCPSAILCRCSVLFPSVFTVFVLSCS